MKAEFRSEGRTVAATLADGTVLTHPCRCHIEGEWEDDLEINLNPEEISPEELAGMIRRACWNQDREHHEAEWETLGENAMLLAEHRLGDSPKAALRELELLTERIRPLAPPQGEPLTYTSRSGRVTVTLNP